IVRTHDLDADIRLVSALTFLVLEQGQLNQEIHPDFFRSFKTGKLDIFLSREDKVSKQFRTLGNVFFSGRGAHDPILQEKTDFVAAIGRLTQYVSISFHNSSIRAQLILCLQGMPQYSAFERFVTATRYPSSVSMSMPTMNAGPVTPFNFFTAFLE